MLQIDDTIISEDVLEIFFSCDLKKCKGACCVHGDSGAPLEKDEAVLLTALYGKIKPYMCCSGIEVVELIGTSVIDQDGDLVTPLVNGKECAYVVFEKGVAKCAIEKAFQDGAIDFQKPVSCHLYPIRLNQYKSFVAVNYHCWEICKPALKNGSKNGTPLYQFLAAPLIRKFGQLWFEKLSYAAENMPSAKRTVAE